MNDLAATRTAIAAALEIVLPGRVSPYPPTSKRWSTPSVFIDQAVPPFKADHQWFATFPVWIVVDGANDAQIAMMDDLLQNCWLALRMVPGDLSGTVQQLAGFRAAVIDCTVMVDVDTMCPPAPATVAEIPPVTRPVPAIR